MRHGRCMGLGRPAARPQPPTERLEGRPVSGLADRRRRRAASGEGAPGLLRGPGLPAPALNSSGQEAQWLPRARGALAVGVWFPLTVAGAAQALRPGRMPLRHGLKTRTCFPFNPLTARKQPWGTCQAGRRPFRMRWRMGVGRRPGAIVMQRWRRLAAPAPARRHLLQNEELIEGVENSVCSFSTRTSCY